jgi:sirohydrochlorin cobaltochelatase
MLISNCLARSFVTGFMTSYNGFLIMTDQYSGVLVIAHGMRDPSGSKAFFQMVDWVRQLLPNTPVEGAFLEFAQPTIPEAAAKLTSQGAKHIAAVPMFLSAVGHTLDDIPKAVAEAEKQVNEGSGFRVQGSESEYRSSCERASCEGDFASESWNECEKVQITIKSHIGPHQRVVELSALRFHQSLEGRREIPSKETLCIIAAHGSPEPEAIEELAAFATRRAILTPVDRVEPCFAVMGKPQLIDILQIAVKSAYKRIVVQPHLLLPGRYSQQIQNQVDTISQDYPNIDWVVTEPLGPDKLLAKAAAEIVDMQK